MKKLSKDPRNVARRKASAERTKPPLFGLFEKPKAKTPREAKGVTMTRESPAIPLFKIEPGESISLSMNADGTPRITKHSVDASKCTYSLGVASDPDVERRNDYGIGRTEHNVMRDNGCTAEIKPTSEVQQAFNEIFNQLDRLNFNQDRLRDRIDSVLGPSPPTGKTEPSNPCMSMMASRLNDIATRIRDIADVESDLANRVML